MSACRNFCTTNGWVPLYHYTMPALGQLILDSGLRMSTQGQGDGGVYFSLLGPASFQVEILVSQFNRHINIYFAYEFLNFIFQKCVKTIFSW